MFLASSGFFLPVLQLFCKPTRKYQSIKVGLFKKNKVLQTSLNPYSLLHSLVINSLKDDTIFVLFSAICHDALGTSNLFYSYFVISQMKQQHRHAKWTKNKWNIHLYSTGAFVSISNQLPISFWNISDTDTVHRLMKHPWAKWDNGWLCRKGISSHTRPTSNSPCTALTFHTDKQLLCKKLLERLHAVYFLL